MEQVIQKANYVKFRAKDIKTGLLVYGDLAYVENTQSHNIHTYIVRHRAYGGNLYITTRNRVKPETIEQLIGFNESGEVYSSIYKS